MRAGTPETYDIADQLANGGIGSGATINAEIVVAAPKGGEIGEIGGVD